MSDPEQVDQNWKPRSNPWLIAIVVALAAFMEMLDTSIANVALPHICGSMGASQDQGTWVLTTYLVTNAIVLPITGWITSVVGRKRFFLICILLFCLASLFCGMAPSLEFLLLARAIQGAGGGGMVPMALSIMADSFPQRLRGMAFSLFAITTVVAPAVGPTLGGWITDNYSWRWIFFINIPIGLIALALVWQLVDDPPFLRRLKAGERQFDYIGFSALAFGVGALQIMLDKGQEDDWLGSHFILTLAIVTVVCLSFLILWEWYEKRPIVDVRLFKFRNFTGASAVMFFAGVTSFSATVIMPQFLQQLMGYTAEKAGLVVSAGAALMIVIMPIVGMLTSKVPLKYLILFGWLGSSASMYLSMHMISMGTSFGSASLMMLVQYAPMGFIFVPALSASYIGIPNNKSDAVSGLSNFLRNIGMSVGTSLVQTVVARREQFHVARLVDHTSLGDTNFVTQFQGLASMQHQSSGVGAADALGSALARIYQLVVAQASTLGYADVYFLISVMAAGMILFSFLIKTNDPRQTEQHAH